MQGLGLKRVEKMVVVTDNWYPCFEGNKVKVSLFISNLEELNYHFVRICVWGKDDFGLEMDYENENYEELVRVYEKWKDDIFNQATDGINKEWFYQKGFYNA